MDTLLEETAHCSLLFAVSFSVLSFMQLSVPLFQSLSDHIMTDLLCIKGRWPCVPSRSPPSSWAFINRSYRGGTTFPKRYRAPTPEQLASFTYPHTAGDLLSTRQPWTTIRTTSPRTAPRWPTVNLPESQLLPPWWTWATLTSVLPRTI